MRNLNIPRPEVGLSPLTIHVLGEIVLHVNHSFECETWECTGTADHVSKADGARLCAICKEIEEDVL